MTVCFTNKNIHAQCIDDDQGHTLAAVSTNHSEFKAILPNTEVRQIGQVFGDALSKGGIDTIVFDRAGRKYHGCVKFLPTLFDQKISNFNYEKTRTKSGTQLPEDNEPELSAKLFT